MQARERTEMVQFYSYKVYLHVFNARFHSILSLENLQHLLLFALEWCFRDFSARCIAQKTTLIRKTLHINLHRFARYLVRGYGYTPINEWKQEWATNALVRDGQRLDEEKHTNLYLFLIQSILYKSP